MDAAEKAATEAEEAAALDAGFNDADLEPVTPQKEDKPQDEAKPQGEELKPEPQPEAPKYLTMDDVNAIMSQREAALKQQFDKVFGTIGNLQQKMDAAKGDAKLMTPGQWGKLKENFPELYELLAEGKDMTAEPEQAKPAPAVVQPIDVEAIVQERLTEKEQALERRLLKRDHPDWETLVAGEDFAAWRDTVLAPAEAAQLADTWDADFISGKLTAFKAWKANQQTAAETAAQKKAAEEAKSKQRLEAAITPQGTPRPPGTDPEDEEAAMLLAFGR